MPTGTLKKKYAIAQNIWRLSEDASAMEFRFFVPNSYELNTLITFFVKNNV